MFKIVAVLYIVCFSLFVLFSRNPDYFDSEFTQGTIFFTTDSSTNDTVAKASFELNGKTFVIDASYLFKRYHQHQKVSVIYELSQPRQAAVYSFWGYWIKWQELLVSVVLIFVLFRAAVAITSNPSPEGLISELEGNQPGKRKYN